MPNSTLPANDLYALLDSRRSAFANAMRAQGLNLPSLGFLRTAVDRIGDSNILAFSDPETPDPEVTESDMTATFTITTPDRDRYGDVVLARGCEKTLDQYLKNPLVFFGHKSSDKPIATSSPPVITDAGIRATATFHGMTEESNCVFAFVAAKILKATSIGFLPSIASILNEDDEDGENIRPKKTDDGEKIVYFDGWMPLRFLEWTLLEWSVVSIPANPGVCDSLTSFIEKGKVGDTKIPASIRKALEPYTLKARVWAHGFDPTRTKYSGVLQCGASEIEYEEGKLVRVDKISMKTTPAQDVVSNLNSDPPLKQLLPPGDKFTLPACARCGKDHADLTLKAFSKPTAEYTHFTTCPDTAEPIMLAFDSPDPDLGGGTVPPEQPDADDHGQPDYTEQFNKLCICMESLQKSLDTHCTESKAAHAELSTAIGKMATQPFPEPLPKQIPLPMVPPPGPAAWEIKLLDMLQLFKSTQEALQQELFRATGRRTSR